MDLSLLCLSAALAGFVDAIVGGGGLIQLPALLLLLPPPLAASIPAVFGTNKMSSVCGTGMAVWQYSRALPVRWGTLLPAAAAAFALSFLGARSVALIRPEILRPLILVLLAVVAVWTFWQKDLGKLHSPKLAPDRERLCALIVGAVIGFYDGFFGPGTGSFLIFAFVGLLGFDFLNASASAKVINLATNLGALSCFISAGQIYWEYAVPMGVCNLLGAFAGARLAMLKGNRFVRGIFLTIVTFLLLRLGWDLWRG